MQSPQTDKPEFSRFVVLSDIPPHGFARTFEADEAERTALSARFDLLTFSHFSAEIHLMPAGTGELELTGTIKASLTQASIVTLEPVPSELDFPISVLFTKEPPDPEEEDDVEELVDPLDIGEILAQYLGVALEPYPRNAGEEFSGLGSESTAGKPGNGRPNPFAVLKKLQDRT